MSIEWLVSVLTRISLARFIIMQLFLCMLWIRVWWCVKMWSVYFVKFSFRQHLTPVCFSFFFKGGLGLPGTSSFLFLLFSFFIYIFKPNKEKFFFEYPRVVFIILMLVIYVARTEEFASRYLFVSLTVSVAAFVSLMHYRGALWTFITGMTVVFFDAFKTHAPRGSRVWL